MGLIGWVTMLRSAGWRLQASGYRLQERKEARRPSLKSEACSLKPPSALIRIKLFERGVELLVHAATGALRSGESFLDCFGTLGG